jgi:competence protein ComEA
MLKFRHLAAIAALLAASAVLAAEPVDINTASAESLAAAISGVGITKARAIVTYREQNGPFESVDDLARVSGIGSQTVDRARGNLTVKTSPQ